MTTGVCDCGHSYSWHLNACQFYGCRCTKSFYELIIAENNVLQNQLGVAMRGLNHISKHPFNYGYEIQEHWATRIADETLTEIKIIGG